VSTPWTPRNTEPHDENVEAYSNCEQVELLLNGRSLGSQSLPADASPRSWKIPFEPGTLKGVGRNHGQIAATHELRTAGKPAKILLAPDYLRLTPSWDDVSYVKASVVDAQGVLIPDAGDLITFELTGPGLIAAVDSGDNSSHEAFHANTRRAYQGLCFAILKASKTSGQIRLTASAPGLASGAAMIEGASAAK
jgi:beta-galactosidase